MKRSLRSEFSLLFIILFATILSVWVVFFVFMSSHIYENTESQMTATAGQIVDDLGKEFANLERVCYALSTQRETVSFVQTEDMEERLAFAGDIDKILQSGNYASNLAAHVIAISQRGWYYRFAGKLSNASAERLSILADGMNLPANIAIELENTRYIGYATGIYDGSGTQSGTLMMFTEEAGLLDKLYMYSPDNSLFIGIVVDGEMISANLKNYPDLNSKTGGSLVRKHIGITPFEIIVAADQSQLTASTYYFSISALIMVLSFAAVLILFARIQNKRLITPMIKIMHSAETVDISGGQYTLPLSGSEEFDRLIEKINSMLVRIDKQNDEIITSGLKLKNAEIAKQKAIIFSLKKQINAHFIINTLSTIKILLEEDDYKRASEALFGLSALIRYAYTKDELVSLWDEMHTLEKYVEIMNIRYNNKITVNFDVDDRLMDVLMPRLLLQPIVENSILHGFHNMTEGCTVEVSAHVNGKNVCISIGDNGEGMEESLLTNLIGKINSSEELPDGIDNIALINIKNRLKTQYGSEFTFTMGKGNRRGVTLIIEIPAALK